MEIKSDNERIYVRM